MPEGDTIERIAVRLTPLFGTTPKVRARNARYAILRIEDHLDGRLLIGGEARGWAACGAAVDRRRVVVMRSAVRPRLHHA